ncbi:MAG: hypothetical protein KatS3mg126_1681 [Lysobacteraceae bacterium]|nr:MAG: hypothetical protein KatS3mg126_1681 [Xanthomonadaceae bacterium]
MRRLLLPLAALLLLPALPAIASSGDTTTVRWLFSDGVLAMWDLHIRPRRAESVTAHEDPAYPGYHGWREEVKSAAADAAITLTGMRLQRGRRVLALDALRLRLDPAREGALLTDEQDRAWLVADMAHQRPGPQLDWRHLSLRLLPQAARALGVPELSQVVLGTLAIAGGPNLSAKGAGDCAIGGNWPGPGRPADVALTALDFVGALGSRDCSSGACIEPSPAGSSQGEVVVAPDARLLNIGSRDVAWFTKFYPQSLLPPDLPYGSDQHPYLAWALYREDADGSLVPLGTSGVKHAFFAQNAGCPCEGAYVLFPGCGDLYSAPTNDMGSALGPRAEIDPHTGRWGRCGSVFDPDCDGLQDSSGYAGRFDRRLLAAEADLLPALHPGARWFIEAWYVVRDDGNLDNSMAHREILPSKQGTGWTFRTAGSLQQGPVIERWVSRHAATPRQHASRLDSTEGSLQVAVRVEETGACRYRYRYAIMNLDHAHAVFSGTPPNLRLQSSTGLAGLRWPIPRAAIEQPRFRDDDRNPGNDWPVPAAGELHLAAPAGADLGWGRMIHFRFDSARAPQPGLVELVLGDGSMQAVQTLLPGGEAALHCDGFEAAPGP